MDIPQEKSIILGAIKSKHNVCVTGAAGTGKSFLLKLIKDHFPHVHVTASTGVAAVNVAGVTIHSWSGIGNATLPVAEIARFINSGPGTKIRRQLRKAKLLAIDEISMISASTLNLLDQVFQMVRQNQRPFGGIQLVVLGDFYQLPPVSNTNQVEFCFSSDSWIAANFKHFELSEIFRQSDLRFIQLLDNIRHAELNDEDLEILRMRQEAKLPDNSNPTLLVTHNYQADKINQEKLNSLKGEEEFTYQMTESGRDNAVAFLKKNCIAQSELTLRLGAQVMMLKNTLAKQGIINGSVGVVTGFSKDKLPIVTFANGETCIIMPEEWSVEVFNEEKQIKEVTGTIKQLPLTLAWAITIHKSQGMTLEQVLCDLSNVFADGQAYVAFSRVKSIDGLYIKGFKPSSLRVNAKVREFYMSNLSCK